MKVTIIGYNTYDSNKNFVGGTEMITDALLRYFLNKGSVIRYYITRKFTNKMKEMYSSDYNCELLTKSDLSLNNIEDFNPDLVVVSICSYDTKDICKNIISKITKCPVLIYGHGPNCCYISNYTKDVINNNFYFTYLSEVEKSQYLEFGLNENRIFKIINPVLLKESYQFNNNYKYDLISTSRIVHQKGILNAVNLCKKLNYKLAMVGVATSQNKILQESNSILKDNFDYLGVVSRSEISDLIKQSKFLIYLPNAQEGESPLSVLEAMALGTPVITWDDFGIKNIVNPEYNIILNHSEDYIEQFIMNYHYKLDQYLSENNKKKLSEYTLSNFGIDSYYNKLDKIIDSIRS